MSLELHLLDSSPGRDGWYELRLASTDGEEPPRVLLKLGIIDGRAGIVRVVIDGKLNSQTLREIPLTRAEAWFNAAHPWSDRTRAEELVGPREFAMDPEVLEDLKSRHRLFPDEFEQVDNALDRYLELTEVKPGVHSPVFASGVPREPLTRPDGTDPDGFSKKVAAAYRDALFTTSKPAVLMAEEADVPVTTVHRWIREARQRGHLPKAQKGRAG